LKQGNNGFLGPKLTKIGRCGWQERNVITFPGMSGTPRLNSLASGDIFFALLNIKKRFHWAGVSQDKNSTG